MRLAKSRWTADESGFSLIETLVATTVLAVGVAGLAQLFVVSTNANRGARTTTFAAVLAEQKLEQLRSLTWGYDTLGLPVSDTTSNITVEPETATGGVGLTPSPAGALKENVDGYCDFIDVDGASLGSGTTPPAGTIYIRRWSIEPLPTNPNNSLVFQVLVTRRLDRGSDTSTSVRRLPEEARIISVKTRKAT